MVDEYLTREEFEFYKSVQEKKRHLSGLHDSLKNRYFYRGLSTVNTIGGTSVAAASIFGATSNFDNPIYFVPLIAVSVIGAAVAASGIVELAYNVGRIRDISYKIGKVESELEQIKEDPKYKELYLTE